MNKDTFDELIAMAEELVCLNSLPILDEAIKQMPPMPFKWYGVGPSITAVRTSEPWPCPHCRMLERLRKLKAECLGA
jgi:hypothetical protein